MTKYDMVLRSNFIQYFWWKLMPGTSITVKSPPKLWGISSINYYYRPYLEENVGKQGWDWNWKYASDGENIFIRFRKGKEKWASIIAIMWT